MAKKFVISRNLLIIGNVQFHMDLVDKSERHAITGGGYWHKSLEKNTMYFYGTSRDFGSVSFEEFDKCVKPESVERYDIYFSEKNDIFQVLEEERLENL